MIDEIKQEPVIGDAIIKTETITFEQMNQEINQANLLYNPEMNVEMQQKWNKERIKYFNENSDKEKHERTIRLNKLRKDIIRPAIVGHANR